MTQLPKSIDLYSHRKNYKRTTLKRVDLKTNPVDQFQKWLEEAIISELLEPNAMVLGTSINDIPSTRTVLLKSFNQEGFIFFTNYNSRKGKEISTQNNVSLLFPWYLLERQVIILGKTVKISREDSENYFKSRPIQSQIGAWASEQSKVISSRNLLEENSVRIEKEYKNKQIPLPKYWGGYRVIPYEFEFWQGRENRLHDRFIYRKLNKEHWKIERLSP
tara:strand:+ start:582 stop:1238 length:657 start_codon:yes stop_codon:yes gene_type:complete